MRWYACSLPLDDGRDVDWQVQGASPTDARRELAKRWTLRLGDAADFGAAEIAAVLFLGELYQEELEPVSAKMRVGAAPARRIGAIKRESVFGLTLSNLLPMGSQ